MNDHYELIRGYARARAALIQNGATISETGEPGSREIEFTLPGRRNVLRGIEKTNAFYLSKDDQPLGSVTLPDDWHRAGELTASLLHNVDVEIMSALEGVPPELFDLGNALFERADFDFTDMIKTHDHRFRASSTQYWEINQDLLRFVLDLPNRVASCAWEANSARLSLIGKQRMWDTESSLIMWKHKGWMGQPGAVANNTIPSENGQWSRISSTSSAAFAAQCLDYPAKLLLGTDGSEFFALEADYGVDGVPPGQIIAAAEFRYGDFVGLIRHTKHEMRPPIAMTSDLVAICKHVLDVNAEPNCDDDFFAP